MKRTINKSQSDVPLKMKKTTNATSSLTLGQPKVNKHIVFNEDDEAHILTSDGKMERLPTGRLMPEPVADATSSEEESDEEAAPAVCSLKTSIVKTQAVVLEEEKELKLIKLKEIKAKKEKKDLRAKQHQRNLKHKLEKSERAKKLEELMMEKSLVQDTAALLEVQRRAESSEDGYGSSDGENEDLTTALKGKRTVFEDDDNVDELEDIFRPEAAAPKNGVHVVSLETTDDYTVQKAIEFKNRMFFGSSVKRMSNASYKSAEDKRNAKKSVQMARNLRLARQM